VNWQDFERLTLDVAKVLWKDADCVASLLIVVYGFRNNLFHGAKWGYELEGQLQNFTMANDMWWSNFCRHPDRWTICL